MSGWELELGGVARDPNEGGQASSSGAPERLAAILPEPPWKTASQKQKTRAPQHQPPSLPPPPVFKFSITHWQSLIILASAARGRSIQSKNCETCSFHCLFSVYVVRLTRGWTKTTSGNRACHLKLLRFRSNRDTCVGRVCVWVWVCVCEGRK